MVFGGVGLFAILLNPNLHSRFGEESSDNKGYEEGEANAQGQEYHGTEGGM